MRGGYRPVHEQTHLDDRVGLVVLSRPVPLFAAFLFDFKEVVGAVIVEYTGVSL